MTIIDLINSDTIIPATKEERFNSLPPAWMIYEVLKWGDWYISPVDSNGEAPPHESMIFVTATIPNGYVHVLMSRHAIMHDPAYASFIVSVNMKNALSEHIGKED